MIEKMKLKVIVYIDYLLETYPDGSIGRDLRQMRNRYIFKDISEGEFRKDMKYLRNIRNMKQDLIKAGLI